jgi:hypothetical protein
MRASRSILVAVVVATASLAGATGAAARTPVDPTSLTPPLQPFRVCWQLGPYVQCDTSSDPFSENEPVDVAPCGQLYETAEYRSHATRWYQDGLIIRRQVQEHVVGTWSLSPTGAGPAVTFMRDASWDERFTTPGDIGTGVSTVQGASLRVPALGAMLHESGQFLPDDTFHGLFTSDEPSDLCALLVG